MRSWACRHMVIAMLLWMEAHHGQADEEEEEEEERQR